jgi:hypothetical protein
MKKVTRLFLGAIISVCLLTSCTAEDGINGVDGKDGADGTNGANGTNSSTTSQGKTYVFITGNITNAQAATQIAQEVGPNTTHISISNTTGLTAIDLSTLTTVWEIFINYNLDLATVNLNGLKSINSLNLSNDNKLQSVSLNNLTTSSYISLSSCPITSLDIPQLKFGNLQIFGVTSLSSLSVPLLTIGGVYITGTSLVSLNLPMLDTANGNFFVSSNKHLTSISIPNLTSVNTSSYVYLSSNSLPSSEINKLLNSFNTKITMTGADSKSIYLQGQTPKAPPTGQGITDKNALVS